MRRARKLPGWVALVAALGAPAPATPAQDAEALLRGHDCTLCHARDETRTGPSWLEIAQRHRGDRDAVPKLVAVVRKGAHGPGPWPMPPMPQVPDAEARRMVEAILAAGRGSP